MKNFFKTISMLLIISIVTTILPVNILAEEELRNNNTTTPEIQNQLDKTEPRIIGEITEKREKNIKHFLKDDMTYEAVVYPVSVHYQNGAQWQDIDNTLVEQKDENDKDVLVNKGNDYKIEIAKDASAKKLVRVKKGEYELSWGIEGAGKSSPIVVGNSSDQSNSLSDNEKKKNLTKISSTVNFTDVFPNIDLMYHVGPEEVKEYVILNEKIEYSEFVFYLGVKNLVARLKEDKSIVFYNDQNASTEVFIMNAPFMFDVSGAQSSSISVDLQEAEVGYKLILKLDNEWLSSPDRIYPVKIDPSLSTSTPYYSDGSVCSSNPDANYYSPNPYMEVRNSNGVEYKSYFQFTQLPQLSSSDYMIGAYFYANLTRSSTVSGPVKIQKVLTPWNEQTLTWNTQPISDTKVVDYVYVNNTPLLQQYIWNITKTVHDWYTNGNNYGMMLKTDSPGCLFEFNLNYSYPYISIWYENNTGLENPWTYHSQNVGRAGTSYENDGNGNFTMVHDDLTMNGSKMPVTIKHIFNNNDRGTNIGFGSGWRLNYSQTLKPKTIDGNNYYVYTDEDGTNHYFRDVYPLYNVLGGLSMDLWLTKNENGTFTIKDKKDNKINFTTTGYLSSLINNNSNTITLGYNTDGITLKTITDGVGRMTTLNYLNGNLLNISDPSGRITRFDYTGNNLTKITYHDLNYSLYTYDVNNNMSTATNFDGYKMVYSYYNSIPYRFQKAQESHVDGTLGQELSVTYGYKTTTFTDIIGRSSTYQFDNKGRTINIVDSDGNAVNYRYTDVGCVSDRIKYKSKPQRTVINYLKNHNTEVSNNDWTVGNWSGSTGSGTYTIETRYLGNQSLKVAKTNTNGSHFMSQQLTLTKGKSYTFSSYIKTNGISTINSKGAAIFVTYKNNAGLDQTIESPFVIGTSDWQRLEVKFTLPSDASSNIVYVRAGIIEETGTAYFDCLQLDDGYIANRYNLIENQDFKYGVDTPDFWTKSYSSGSSDTLVTSSDTIYPPKLDKNCYKITGDPSLPKSLYQTLNIQGNSGDVFTLSGWAKGSSGTTALAEFSLDIEFLSGSYVYQRVNIQFNKDIPEWQYVSDKIITTTSYTSVNIYLNYNRNINEAYFDGIQLYKEEYGKSYQYDSYGNVLSVNDLANQAWKYEYNTTNDITKSINPDGYATIYTYDTKHNLLTSTTAENVISTFTYDSYGNPLTSKVGDSNLFVQSSSTHTTSGNYMKTNTDPSGNTITFNSDETKGTLASFEDSKGKLTSYSYDMLDRLLDTYKTADGQLVNNSYSYENDHLKTITHNGFNYGFIYDSLGNASSVTIGGQSLVTNTYETRTSRLLETTYGNGQIASNEYDNLDRLISKKYNGTARYRYEYDASGNLGYCNDLVNGTSFRYIYDMANRLVKVSDSYNNSLSFEYDKRNNTAKVVEKLDISTYTTNYEYDKDNRIKKVTAHNGSYTTYTYDTVSRLANKTVNTGSFQYNSTSSFLAGVNGSSTYKLGTITNNGSQISYTYDANGNIETIMQGGNQIKYCYNELNEVIREDNQVLGKTITYAYDIGGNFTSKVEYNYTTDPVPSNPIKTYTLAYDPVWKDKMTSYDGKAITYDEIGNPLLYDGWTYSWEMGRQLATMSKAGQNLSFKYNDSGIRAEKTVNGVATKYHLVGDRVTYQNDGIDKIYYTYDANGKLISMNLNGTEYYYIRNGQDDIIGLFDSTGTQVVTYTYDTWGKLVSTTGSLASTVGVKNPYRYRSYRYDTETGLYYLNSRYYNPEWGRFINADSNIGTPGLLLSHNLFAYCWNNPVNLLDEDGENPVAIGIAAGAVGGPAGMIIGGCIGGLVLVVGIILIDNAKRSQSSTGFSSSTPANPDPNDDDDDFFKGVNTSKWNEGSFNSSKDSFRYHFNKHGSEVEANTPAQYFQKAFEFSKSLKGATKKYIDGAIDGVIRYTKNGKFIDIAPDGTIISFGAI